MPGHVHLQPLCQAIKLGIAEAGGTPLEFPSIAVCDGLATGHAGMRMPMLSREIIADSIELMVTAHAFDAHGAADQLRQGHAGHADGRGPAQHPGHRRQRRAMEAGCYRGRAVCYTDLIEAEALVARGEMSAEDLAEFERRPTRPRLVRMMGTANSMNMLAEALGMTLPGARADARHAGERAPGRWPARRAARSWSCTDRNLLPARHHDARCLRERHRAGHGHRRLDQLRACTCPPSPHEAGVRADHGRLHRHRRAHAAPGPAQARRPALRRRICTTAGGVPAVMNELARHGLLARRAR